MSVPNSCPSQVASTRKILQLSEVHLDINVVSNFSIHEKYLTALICFGLMACLICRNVWNVLKKRMLN